jgi:transposase
LYFSIPQWNGEIATLKDNYDLVLTAFDQLVFEKLVPSDHYLRRLKAVIDFSGLRAMVADCYSPDQGRGAIDPVRVLKLLLLQFHYGLSDEGVIQQAQVNVAFRFFLDLPLEASLPEPSLLSQFRTRLGQERFTQVFHEVLRQAREKGLVKDRLRLKDATHVLANIAVPATIRLVAQVRTRLLDSAECFAQVRKSQCRDCPLRSQCVAPSNHGGRKVTKNDFQAQYDAARKRATTDEYKQVRKEHPRIERKLNELVRWRDGRRVRYRGRLRAKAQYVLLAVVVNCKRIVRLLMTAPNAQFA